MKRVTIVFLVSGLLFATCSIDEKKITSDLIKICVNDDEQVADYIARLETDYQLTFEKSGSCYVAELPENVDKAALKKQTESLASRSVQFETIKGESIKSDEDDNDAIVDLPPVTFPNIFDAFNRLLSRLNSSR